MSGTLVNRRARHLGPLWRKYWAARWHHIPAWSAERLAPLLNTGQARQAILVRGRQETRPALVADFPDGKAPFLGVLTLGADGKPSSEAGVLQFPMRGHLLTVAPTRTGKGTCHIIPNLLLYGGSALVIDVKGENYAATADHRRRMFPNAAVRRFAPLESASSKYNPLSFIRSKDFGGSTADTYDDVRLVAEMLLPAKDAVDYWMIESRNLLAMLIYYVAIRYTRFDEERRMRSVIELLFPSGGIDSERKSGIDRSLETIIDYARAHDEVLLLSLASSFIEHEPKVYSNIVSSCRADLQIWLSPRLLDATDRSDFLFSDLKSSMCRPLPDTPAPTTLYVVIPPRYLQEYRGVLRMMVGLAIAELTRDPDWADQEGFRSTPPCDVLFLLDELPILGFMPPIVQGLAYLAGYGVQIWTFVQNIGQLKEIYKDEWHTFFANAGAMSFFGVNDVDTAEYLARLLGETAEYESRYMTFGSSDSTSHSRGTSSGTSGGWSNFSSNMGDSNSVTQQSGTSANENVRFVREPIARPADIRALDPDLQFVLMRNTPPILATKMPYYDFPLFTRDGAGT